MFGLLAGKKTYVTSAMTILGAVAGVLTGTVAIPDAIQLGITAILAMTLRSGIK